MVIRFGSKSIKEVSDDENARAEAEQNKAKLDYLAMMCDVEFPTEEGGNDNELQ